VHSPREGEAVWILSQECMTNIPNRKRSSNQQAIQNVGCIIRFSIGLLVTAVVVVVVGQIDFRRGELQRPPNSLVGGPRIYVAPREVGGGSATTFQHPRLCTTFI